MVALMEWMSFSQEYWENWVDTAIPEQIAQLLIVLGDQRDSKPSGQDRNGFKREDGIQEH